MNQSFFIASVGAHQQLKRLTVHGNNIANLNTYGFKAEKSRFASLMYDDLKAIGEAEDGTATEGHEMLASGAGGLPLDHGHGFQERAHRRDPEGPGLLHRGGRLLRRGGLDHGGHQPHPERCLCHFRAVASHGPDGRKRRDASG